MVVNIVMRDISEGGRIARANGVSLEERPILMAARWPDYAQIVAPDQEIGQDVDVERASFDDGLVQQERRFSSALATFAVTGLLDSDDDLARFRAWARAHAHRWFSWRDPATGRPVRVRVRGGSGGIAYTARVANNNRRWTLEATLEGLTEQ